MAAGQDGLVARLGRQGYGALQPADGLAVLGRALAGLCRDSSGKGAGNGSGIPASGAPMMAAPFHWARFLTGAVVCATHGGLLLWPSKDP